MFVLGSRTLRQVITANAVGREKSISLNCSLVQKKKQKNCVPVHSNCEVFGVVELNATCQKIFFLLIKKNHLQ